jgi:hypothetical protein
MMQTVPARDRMQVDDEGGEWFVEQKNALYLAIQQSNTLQNSIYYLVINLFPPKNISS